MNLSRKIVVSIGGCLLMCLLLTAGMAVAETTKRNLTVDDKNAFQSVGSPVYSPDGKWLAYTINSSNVPENKSNTRIWKVSAEGGTPVPMTSELASSR